MATSTLHPLPFEHLDPKRFEDLARQLAYDFRPWRSLEATGRSGSDDGFDARAYEPTGAEQPDETDPADGDDQDSPTNTVDRLWLIQCKREKAIGPAKMKIHLAAIPADSFANLYGVLIVAACDLSKATRDACREWCRDRGVQEVHLWGKAEIEDQLFQPKNDNLLFAYFGFSLRIRKQSVASGLRRITTLKRKIRRHLAGDGWPGTPLLLRDPADDRYPYSGGKAPGGGDLRWRGSYAKGVGVSGLRVVMRCFSAFHSRETGQWDIISVNDRSVPSEVSDTWAPDSDVHAAAVQGWWRLPRSHQAHLVIVATLPYEEILEIDEVGDDVCPLPVVFSTFKDGKPPFNPAVDLWLEHSGDEQVSFDPAAWVRLFPDGYRDLSWEANWRTRNPQLAPSSEPFEFVLPDGTVWRPDAPPAPPIDVPD
jgi:hypothetical protein